MNLCWKKKDKFWESLEKKQEEIVMCEDEKKNCQTWNFEKERKKKEIILKKEWKKKER